MVHLGVTNCSSGDQGGWVTKHLFPAKELCLEEGVRRRVHTLPLEPLSLLFANDRN